MTRMSWRPTLMVVLALLCPTLAQAQVEISDWTGAKVRMTAGTVTNDGVKISYHTAGDGPLVVMIHGMGEYWFDWRQQIPSLVKKYKVVAISLRGSDESDKPTGVEAYASAKIATDIDAVIRHFGLEKAIIMAYDSGGIHGWYFAMHYPQRVERLVSIGMFHPASVAQVYATNPAQQQVGQYSRNFQENPEAAATMTAQRRNPNAPMRTFDTPDTHKMRLEGAQRTAWESFINFYKANWPRPPYTLDSQVAGGTRSDFPKVKAPTLVIYGREDRPLLVNGLNDLWQWVDSELTMLVLPGHGHGPHQEIPDFVTPRILDWLATRERPAFVYPPTSPIKTP